MIKLTDSQVMYETNALNKTKMPARSEMDRDRLDQFVIEVEEPRGPSAARVFYVNGKALEKFAQVGVNGREESVTSLCSM